MIKSSIHPEQLSLSLLSPPTMSDSALDSARLKSAYTLWYAVWRSTMNELGLKERLFSDAFSRQSEILTIFNGTDCVGMLLLRFLDFNSFNFSDDSYFKHWTPDDVSALLAHGSKIMTSSYLTVSPDYRYSKSGVSFKDVILDLMVKRFLQTPADTIAGITRREKGIHLSSYALGATPVREDLPFHSPNDRVDLLAFYRHNVCPHPDAEVRRWSDALIKPNYDRISRAA